MPISEYQSDTHSFGFRQNRSAVEAIAILYKRCIKTQSIKSSSSLFTKTCSVIKKYINLKFTKYTKRKFIIGKTLRKTRQNSRKKIHIFKFKNSFFLNGNSSKKKVYKFNKYIFI